MAVNFLAVSKCCANLLTMLIKSNSTKNSYPQKFGITITKVQQKTKIKLKVLFKKNANTNSNKNAKYLNNPQLDVYFVLDLLLASAEKIR